MTPPTKQAETTHLPILSSSDQGWDNIVVEQFRYPAGEGHCYYTDAHVICLSLSPRPINFLQVYGSKTYRGLYGKGDISIAPAEVPFFARWDDEDHYLQIRVPSQFIQRVACEALEMKGDRLELMPEFRTRDPQIEAIGSMLLTELQQKTAGNKLYIESLANVLTIHLIRQYTAVHTPLPIYEGGLPQRQLMHVLDYIRDYLHQEIKLTDLASLLGISEFHFSRQFKQALGITPYQYLLHQRIERAKQLLKESDRPITDIAFSCGFNSHSHLTKQFRQLTGMTPKVYRLR
ncbi:MULTISPECIES: AraC family transcriptional regulator [unclassified Leptolyngbya]|uniref:helix-turn-helix domain-containing protein n=1 Tax=unclassified Leptolyngbya TaxID=2650499 RepID=UPI0016844A84|nr:MULTISPECIES: AraC family transcriptional regulator [unclassified Leptolyngbya]MBD1909077.1 helix-turn-helix transcriptional regulator [Leptolyngbya sp. FACHB-8]MBD2157012.1 helix-turn-helix transcriptional regulator [Leptolyngbya sp. FACHB-16]